MALGLRPRERLPRLGLRCLERRRRALLGRLHLGLMQLSARFERRGHFAVDAGLGRGEQLGLLNGAGVRDLLGRRRSRRRLVRRPSKRLELGVGPELLLSNLVELGAEPREIRPRALDLSALPVEHRRVARRRGHRLCGRGLQGRQPPTKLDELSVGHLSAHGGALELLELLLKRGGARLGGVGALTLRVQLTTRRLHLGRRGLARARLALSRLCRIRSLLFGDPRRLDGRRLGRPRPIESLAPLGLELLHRVHLAARLLRERHPARGLLAQLLRVLEAVPKCLLSLNKLGLRQTRRRRGLLGRVSARGELGAEGLDGLLRFVGRLALRRRLGTRALRL